MGSVIRPQIRHTRSTRLQQAATDKKIHKFNATQQAQRNGLSVNSHSRSQLQPQVRPERRQLSDNLDFYSNKIRSKPAPGYTIEEMLKWKGDYDMLERNHRYIQWLFPTPDGRGMNRLAQPLQAHEARAIRMDDRMRKRVLKAYKMMLHFYGMELASELDGSVRRCAENWRHRYRHLNKSKHNYMRITRIIKALGELGLDRYQVPLVRFIIEEAIDHDELPALRGSIYYWIYAIKDPHEVDFIRDSVKRVLPEPFGIYNYEGFSEEEDEPEKDFQEYLEQDAAGYLNEGAKSEVTENDIIKTLNETSITGKHGTGNPNTHFYREKLTKRN